MVTQGSGTVAVLAEKPSVARDIASVLGATGRGDGYLHGNGYVVTWAIGHLAALAQHGRVATTVFDRVDFPTAMIDGRTVLEIDPRGRSAAEVVELWIFPRGSHPSCQRAIEADPSSRAGKAAWILGR